MDDGARLTVCFHLEMVYEDDAEWFAKHFTEKTGIIAVTMGDSGWFSGVEWYIELRELCG